jgi:hypothetical protein
VWTREYATTAARKVRAIPGTGAALATPVANAKADAEWPDGNERVRGILTRRATGSR